MGYECFCTCGKFMGYAFIPHTTRMCHECLSKMFPGMPIKYTETGGSELRKLNIGIRDYTEIIVEDEPGQGGACHEYRVYSIAAGPTDPQAVYAKVHFQNGPIKEFGVNGCHQEDLLAIVIDRLESFQAGTFACRENALALTKCQEAMHWLNHRTSNRVLRGVEGTNVK